MSRLREVPQPIQGIFSDITKERSRVSLIPAGVIIYPQFSGRGVLRQDLYANELEDVKIKGLPGFEARDMVYLFFDGECWQLPPGSRFGTFRQVVHKRKLPR